MIATTRDVASDTIMIRLSNERLSHMTENAALQLAAELLGKEIYEIHRARVLAHIKPKHLIKAARAFAEKEISKNLKMTLHG